MKPAVLALVAVALTGCRNVRGAVQAGVEADSHITRPEIVEATDARIATLKAPAGLSIKVFAKELKGARMMASGKPGTVLLSRPDTGEVMLLEDGNGDGVAERVTQVLKDHPGVHGIEVHGGKVLLSTPEKVFVATLKPDGSFDAPTVLIQGLPEGGNHPKRTQHVGPDGKLYVSVGSACNNCNESNPEHATMLRFSLDGSNKEVFARGLRNTIGFGWHPDTHEMWGMDHGSDHRGDDVPPEELNKLEQDKDYGWPWSYAEQQVDGEAEAPPNGTKAERAAASTGMTLGYQAHAAPIEMIFLRAPLGPLRRGDALIAMRGSWNRAVPVGYELVVVRFENGAPTGFDPVVTGFLADGKAFARLAGLLQLDDGSVLLSDDTNGVIYRLANTQ